MLSRKETQQRQHSDNAEWWKRQGQLRRDIEAICVGNCHRGFKGGLRQVANRPKGVISVS